MAQLVLGYGVGVIDLIAKDEEGHASELFHGEQGVELGFGLGEPLKVFRVHEEHDAAYFGEVVFPEATGCWFVR